MALDIPSGTEIPSPKKRNPKDKSSWHFIHQLQERSQDLLNQQTYDPLVKTVYSRHFLGDQIERLSSGRDRYRIFMIDLNKFKQINDNFGHPAGDQCLVQAGQRLRQATREDDLVARYGGDEFIILQRISPQENIDELEFQQQNASLPPIPEEPDSNRFERVICEMVKQRILKAFLPPATVTISKETKQIPVTPSIGYAIFNPTNNPDTLEESIQQADNQLFNAKKSRLL